jgi:hypothetical protein
METAPIAAAPHEKEFCSCGATTTVGAVDLTAGVKSPVAPFLE